MSSFKKGQSGNPAGRPKRKTLTEEIAKLLDSTSPELEEKYGADFTLREHIAQVFIKTLLENPTNARLWALFFERTEGKVVQQLDINKVSLEINDSAVQQQFIEWRKQKLLGLESDSDDSDRRGNDSEASKADEVAEGSFTEPKEEQNIESR